MFRTMFYRSVAAAALSAGIGFAVAGTAFAEPVTIQSVKAKGFSCEHAATNMTVCSKKGEKDWTCSESENSCVQLLVVKDLGRYRAPIGQTRNAVGFG